MKANVIGSGIGGISAAIRLRNMGFNVNVFEKNKNPGGKLNTFKLGDYRFDAGPSLFTMPNLVDELFTMSGENPRNFFKYKKKDIHCKYYWDDGTKFTAFSDKQKFLNEAKEKFKVEDKVLTNYFLKARKKYELTKNIFLNKSLHKLSTYTNIKTIKALFKFNIYQINQTLNQVNSKELKNDYLVQIFNRYATYNGSSPYKTPGMMTLIQHLENNYGTYIPEKGMYDIANSLYELAKRIGVNFYFNSCVTGLNIKNNIVDSIEVNDGKIFKSDYIISNVDTNYFYKNIIKNQTKNIFLEQERSSSAVIYYWGMNKKFENLDLHNILFSSDYKTEFEYIFKKSELYNDPTIYINITSKDVENDAPKNCENWFVMVNAPHNKNQNWENEVVELKKNILEKIERILKCDVEKHIQEERIYSPKNLQKNTNSFQGSLYGTSSNNILSSFLRHPNFSRKFKNLFFCGGSVHPGGGIPLCLLSSKIACDLIENSK